MGPKPKIDENGTPERTGNVKAVIYGDNTLLSTLRANVPERRWRIPAGDDFTAQADFLTRHPVPPGAKGIVLTDRSGNWVPVARAGWIVYWCQQGQVPVGAQELPDYLLRRPVTDMIRELWNIQAIDKRLVADLLLDRTRGMAVLLPVTSNTGGVGKTVTCRRLAERAAQQHVRTLLIDGNIRQSSQRSFFDPMRDHPAHTIADWRPGMKPQQGANPGRMFDVAYDISFAPPMGAPVGWDLYRAYIEEARKRWDFVIVDLDRVSADDLNDPDSAAGGLLVPYLNSGETCLVIVKAGRQTQGDAMNLLSAFAARRLPRECIGIKDTVPAGMSDYQQFDYSRYGTFLGVEHQSIETGKRIAAGESNWDDPQLDEVRERILAWALPGHGFDPELYKPRRKRKGWLPWQR